MWRIVILDLRSLLTPHFCWPPGAAPIFASPYLGTATTPPVECRASRPNRHRLIPLPLVQRHALAAARPNHLVSPPFPPALFCAASEDSLHSGIIYLLYPATWPAAVLDGVPAGSRRRQTLGPVRARTGLHANAGSISPCMRRGVYPLGRGKSLPYLAPCTWPRLCRTEVTVWIYRSVPFTPPARRCSHHGDKQQEGGVQRHIAGSFFTASLLRCAHCFPYHSRLSRLCFFPCACPSLCGITRHVGLSGSIDPSNTAASRPAALLRGAAGARWCQPRTELHAQNSMHRTPCTGLHAQDSLRMASLSPSSRRIPYPPIRERIAALLLLLSPVLLCAVS